MHLSLEASCLAALFRVCVQEIWCTRQQHALPLLRQSLRRFVSEHLFGCQIAVSLGIASCLAAHQLTVGCVGSIKCVVCTKVYCLFGLVSESVCCHCSAGTQSSRWDLHDGAGSTAHVFLLGSWFSTHVLHEQGPWSQTRFQGCEAAPVMPVPLAHKPV